MLPLKYGPYKGAYVPSRGLRQLVVRGCRSLTGWVDFSLPHAAILALLSLPTKILVGRLCYVIFEKSQRCASCNEISPKLIFFESLSKLLILNFTDFTLGRTSDLDSILHTIDKADKFIYIAIGEYIAGDVYKTNSTWRVIDDRLVVGIYNKHLNT